MRVCDEGRSEFFRLGRELALHQAYFEAIDAVVSTLLNPDDPECLTQTLSILVEVSRASGGALYLNEPDDAAARLTAYWPAPGSPAPQTLPAPMLRLSYATYTLLAEQLQAGVVLNKSLLEMSPVAQMLLAPLGARQLVALPLLEQDRCFGFLALFDIGETHERLPAELRLLALLSNLVAQTLLKQRAEAAVLANQARLKVLVGGTQDMVFEINAQGQITHAWSDHPALPPVSLLQGAHLAAALPAGLAEEIAAALPRVVFQGQTVQINCMVPVRAEMLYLLTRLQPIQADGETHVVALVQDVSEVMQEAARRKTMLDTLNLLEEAVLDLTPQGVLMETTAAWARLRGIPVPAIGSDLRRSLLDWVHVEDQPALREALARLTTSYEAHAQRFRLLRQDGESIWVEARLIAQRGPDRSLSTVRGVLRDVTAMHLNEQHITQLALYDTLTRLPNRFLLDDELRQAFERAEREQTRVALGFIDLDHFKEVNDAFGHKTGDELLVNVANRLSAVLQGRGVLARWGGDEFIALIPDLTDLTALRGLAEQLRSAAQQGVMLEGLEARPTISVGFAVYPDNAASPEELLSAADHTMYHAKGAGRNNACFYSDILDFKALGREHMAIQMRMRQAILSDALEVYYQPIVDGGTGEVLAVEALARWHDDAAGWVSPDVFIPMAEKAGLIQELSACIMGHSFSRLAKWRAAGLLQPLMLNVSRNLLFSPLFVSQLSERLEALGLNPGDVILEITESVALTDCARQMKHLRQIVAAGFRVALDDFGTGYSSLSQLHEMAVHFLKVDASFAQRLQSEEGQGVMQAIVQFGQLLKLGVIVEGVETVEIARFLHEIGVRQMQGFHFSEPVPPNVAELMLRLGVAARLQPEAAQA